LAVGVLNLQGDLAATAPDGLGLDRLEKRATNTLSAPIGNNRQVMNIQERTSLKRGEPKETHRNPHRSSLNEGQEHQRGWMLP
jgi:hypothetical protein